MQEQALSMLIVVSVFIKILMILSIIVSAKQTYISPVLNRLIHVLIPHQDQDSQDHQDHNDHQDHQEDHQDDQDVLIVLNCFYCIFYRLLHLFSHCVDWIEIEY